MHTFLPSFLSHCIHKQHLLHLCYLQTPENGTHKKIIMYVQYYKIEFTQAFQK